MEILLLLIIGVLLVVLTIVILKHQKLKDQLPCLVQAQFDTWKNNEMARVHAEQKDAAQREAVIQLEQWKQKEEKSIRQDATSRSRATIVGKVTEHFVPHLLEFTFNPKDARFFGSPIDFVVFDGLDEGCIRKIVFVEVKTQTSSLNTRQRQIRDAVKARRVEWAEVRVNREMYTT